jgi:invasion protein IalB
MNLKLPESPAQRRAAIAAIAVSVVIVAVAETDLHRRPAAQVRGNKRLWQLACTNALPALVYLGFGRR